MSHQRFRAALYARVSTDDQTCENQLRELREYCNRRGWDHRDDRDQGVSGAKERRPALDELLRDTRRRRFDCVVVWRLDRLGRNLKHLITTLDELATLGVSFVSLGEGIDATTAAGRLQMAVLGAIAEFERERIRERVLAGLQRAKAQGQRLGRRRKTVLPEGLPRGLTVRSAAALWNVSKSTAARWLSAGRLPVGQTPPEPPSDLA